MEFFLILMLTISCVKAENEHEFQPFSKINQNLNDHLFSQICYSKFLIILRNLLSDWMPDCTNIIIQGNNSKLSKNDYKYLKFISLIPKVLFSESNASKSPNFHHLQ